ncbi:MAG: zf-HC2 domain-containing protein [Bacteroidetes bacterium]|nr:zf-HC2 domain-containing protein [Bacteroidota bacterium]
MSCIKTDLIQKYIDKAGTEKETDTVRKHIAVCRECNARLTELQHRADEVKKALNILVSDEVAIPGFIEPVGISKTPETTRIKKYVISLAAASVLICIGMAVMFNLKTPKRQQIVVVHTVDREINANQTAAKQKMEINIIDVNGKVTSYP